MKRSALPTIGLMALAAAGIVCLASTIAVRRIAAQANPPPIAVSETSGIAFEHSGLSISGNPLQLVSAQIDVRNATGSILRVRDFDSVLPGAGTTTLPLQSAIQGLPNGEYLIRARVQGVNGVWSAYTPDLPISVNRDAPAIPQNLRVVVTFTIGGP